MHSNNKMITFAVLVSLLIATLFLIPQTAKADSVATPTTSAQTKTVQGTAKKKAAKHVKKVRKHKKVSKKAKKVARTHKKAAKKHTVKRVKKHAVKKIVSSRRIKKHSTYKVRKHLSRANAAAKAWIAYHESGGSYTASNGSCYGKYQLSISYYGGNFSHKNQERTANKYVKSRYGSWVKAKAFWLSHNWY
ncbi:Aggregation promoting protein [Apilactobacillus kunkeei]|uniref:Aggregation promoting protein n=1 Tax=Apilactobacillus waqarii TaxID=2851006 RepID=A0ABS6M3H4_9LACO|nr:MULTISPECIES: hypothetical protein [Apilactobacillus]KOY73842.1 Aggregation promoting protein [Apilactobacillus kunkeei]MBV0914742.1 hypothetical protein [Apilactobacillus waqarii]MCL8495945.1 hypothetical protein [Apilactobacillus sp. F1]